MNNRNASLALRPFNLARRARKVDLLPVLAYYVHDLSPFLIRFTENFGIRWYGLAYVLGFFLGFLLLRTFARRGYSELAPGNVGDFITWCALLGVMVGGRLGYMLLYQRSEFFTNPLVFFNLLGGGMASHGGILGLIIFTFFYSRKHRISWLGLGDNLVVVAPIGICLGRLANFINGELYGHITTTFRYAVQFPSELRDIGGTLAQRVQEALPELHPYPEAVIAAARADPAVREILSGILNPRHPSQIYQALLEGLSLFVILLCVRLRFKNLPHGILTGLFFVLYAFFRIAAEIFRERDADQDPILGMKPGPILLSFHDRARHLLHRSRPRPPSPNPGAWINSRTNRDWKVPVMNPVPRAANSD